MNVRSLLLGLLLGFGAGWVASSLGRPAPAESVDPVAVDAPPTSARAAPVILTGTARSAAAPAGLEALDVPTLQRRLERARVKGDGDAFREALYGLGHDGSIDAHRALIALVRDASLLLPDDLTTEVVGWLRDSEADGVSEAAKARFAIRMKAGYDPTRAGAGWFALIGAHGGAAALSWARTEGWDAHRPLWQELVVGFLESSHRDALPFAREIASCDPSEPRSWPEGLREPKYRLLAFETWVGLDPAAGLPALLAELRLALDPQGRVLSLPLHVILPAYVRHLPEDGLSQALELVRELAAHEIHQREAWNLMHRLQARGLSLAGLEDVILQPTAYLEAVEVHGGPAPEEAPQVQYARRLILGSPWAWSDRSLEAVEHSIEWERWPADQQALRARLLRARTRLRWSGTAGN